MDAIVKVLSEKRRLRLRSLAPPQLASYVRAELHSFSVFGARLVFLKLGNLLYESVEIEPEHFNRSQYRGE